MWNPSLGASLPKRKTTPCSFVGAYAIPFIFIGRPTVISFMAKGSSGYAVYTGRSTTGHLHNEWRSSLGPFLPCLEDRPYIFISQQFPCSLRWTAQIVTAFEADRRPTLLSRGPHIFGALGGEKSRIHRIHAFLEQGAEYLLEDQQCLDLPFAKHIQLVKTAFDTPFAGHSDS